MAEQQHNPMSPGWALFALLGAVVGGAAVAFLATGRVVADSISYTDLAAVLLAAVTLVLTVLGLAIAAAAIWGYREFMKMSADKASAVAKAEAAGAATREVQSYLATHAEPFFERQAEVVALRVITPERLKRLFIEQVNAVALGSVRDDELDDEEREYEQAEESTKQELDDGR